MNKLFVKWICIVSAPHYLGAIPPGTFTESHTSKEATLSRHGEANRPPNGTAVRGFPDVSFNEDNDEARKGIPINYDKHINKCK